MLVLMLMHMLMLMLMLMLIGQHSLQRGVIWSESASSLVHG
jgi:hypothetical protein